MDLNLTRLNMYAPKLEWKAKPDEEAPEGCQIYVGEYNGRVLAIALPTDTGDAWDKEIQQKLKDDQDRLLVISNLDKNINWG